MAVTNGWGQGVINNTNGWGKLATNNIGAGSVYENSASGDTVLVAPSAPSFASTQSFDFDGVDDFIGVSSLDTSVLPTGSFSVSVWFNATTNAHGGLFQIGDFAGNTAINVAKRPNGALRFIVNLSGGSVGNNTTNSKYNLNEWNNVVFVYDNSITTGALKFYVNGVQELSRNESPSGQTISYPAGSELRIGQYNSSGSTQFFFTGNIDETALFNSAFTSSDVSSIYNSGVPNDISSLNPVAWYRMGEHATWDGSKWTLIDQGTSSNNAESVNMVEADRETDVPT